ncbi:aspartyl/asparaginyl beta-hydroxylase domain-containing protein [Leptothoe spongobia]|uniref:Aspartyl/asparaginyl beta-hydroxylase domain-containing protein n=1 Tax=Leptothoe spongobia TAU-MAC 1115 TaxID=1967444 RepID=A0A947DDQ8_9CYAN|nr:aspartyl/asparaginyl beta-hydroxylase domain-containing protein [Leptothoe spongobia]MBT9314061.1 aspartyl/asparaginyl beta-hydroxylase domain-containing protein [Leptothoe spongobia TAU-MAC 1115]
MNHSQQDLLQALKQAAERDYIASVAEVETSLDAELTRFRNVAFTFTSLPTSSPLTNQDLGQKPYFRLFPNLTAKPYWATSDFPDHISSLLTSLESQFHLLSSEFEQGLQTVQDSFDGTATGYFGTNANWRSYNLVTEEGQVIPEALARFPKIGEILTELASQNFLCKTYFALMSPGLHLPPHCGGQNACLRMHWGLRIPTGDLGIRVANIKRIWENGKCLGFDDTFVHEAWNHTDCDRYIMLMRIMHPELSSIERQAYFEIENKFTQTDTYKTLLQLKQKISVNAH